MILADKLIELRKKNGWSQEEMAEKLSVSRQTVSRWEGAQAVPDLQRILQMSELFGVTTDYLLKDEMREAEGLPDWEEQEPLRRVSLAQAQEYLALRRAAATHLAWAVFACILSPVGLIVMPVFAEQSGDGGGAAAAMGLALLLVMVAAAVYVFVRTAARSAAYDFLEEELFETEYGVTGLVKEKQQAFRAQYHRNNTVGILLCILSPITLLMGILLENAVQTVLGVALLLLMVGIAVVLFVQAGTVWSSFEKLLQEGEYSRVEKKKNPLRQLVSGIYWPVVTALYLGWSFVGDAWDSSWILWPMAGVAFAGVVNLVDLLQKRKG